MKKILINLVLSYLRFFARQALAKHKPTVIGITGSTGKSSARTILYAILKDHFPTKMVWGNSETGVPLGILGLKPKSYSKLEWLKLCSFAPLQLNNLAGTKYLIVEMGIDDPYPPKNMEYLLTIVKPDIAILLNVGAAHTMQFEKVLKDHPHPDPLPSRERENFKTEEERIDYLVQKIAEEKAKIITESGCSVGIYNADNKYIIEVLDQTSPFPLPLSSKRAPSLRSVRFLKGEGKLKSFGKNKTNDISYIDYSVDLHGTTFSFLVNNKEKLTITIKDYLVQKEYQETISAVILAALQTGLDIKQIKVSLEKKFTLPKSRSNLLKGINDSIIIDSSYNASRIAVNGMLDLVKTLKQETKRPVVFLFGDMRELGEEAKIEHEKVAEKMFGTVDYLYLVGSQTRDYVLPVIQTNEKEFKEIRWFDSAIRAGEYLKQNLPPNALILVKGSQNTIFLEETIKYILADKKDESKLCRQENFWGDKKTAFSW